MSWHIIPIPSCHLMRKLFCLTCNISQWLYNFLSAFIIRFHLNCIPFLHYHIFPNLIHFQFRFPFHSHAPTASSFADFPCRNRIRLSIFNLFNNLSSSSRGKEKTITKRNKSVMNKDGKLLKVSSMKNKKLKSLFSYPWAFVV